MSRLAALALIAPLAACARLTSDALFPPCGDGIVQAHETCDDGNRTSLDGCSEVCQVETLCPDCCPEVGATDCAGDLLKTCSESGFWTTSSCPTDPNGDAVCSAGSCSIACHQGYLFNGTSCLPCDTPEACGLSCSACPIPPEGTTYVCSGPDTQDACRLAAPIAWRKLPINDTFLIPELSVLGLPEGGQDCLLYRQSGRADARGYGVVQVRDCFTPSPRWTPVLLPNAGPPADPAPIDIGAYLPQCDTLALLQGGLNTAAGFFLLRGASTHPTWIQLDLPVDLPSPIYLARPALNPTTGELFLVGGVTEGRPEEPHFTARAFRRGLGNNATQCAPDPSWTQLPDLPMPIGYPASAIDPIRQVLYVFGGRVASSDGRGVILSRRLFSLALDSASTWQEIVTTDSPSPRMQASLAVCDSGRLVLFGGRETPNPGPDFDDLYILDTPLAQTPTWEQVSRPAPPSKRARAELAAVPSRPDMILVGGVRSRLDSPVDAYIIENICARLDCPENTTRKVDRCDPL